MTARRVSYSLLRRLIWRVVTAAAAFAAILYGALYAHLFFTIDTLRDQNLIAQAEDLSQHLRLADDGTLRLELPDNLAQAYTAPKGTFSYQVLNADDAVLFSSRNNGAPLGEIDQRRSSVARPILIQSPVQTRVYALEKKFDGPTGLLRIRVGQGPSNDDLLSEETLGEFSATIIWLVFPVFAALTIVIAYTLRRGLAPVAEASRQAANIGPRTTEVRLREDGMPAEIRPLVHAVNAGLDRLEHGFQVQRDFTADAAHELRTPLAVLQAHLDTLPNRQAAQALSGDVATMSRIVEQLLRVARLETDSMETDATADLHSVATDVAAHLVPLALRENKTLVVSGHGGPVSVHGEAKALHHAVRNLVENALAVVPPGGKVELVVEADGSLHVDDDGPGVPPALRTTIFQRFWRGDHTGGKTGGAGLGLSIVARIAEVYGGTVDVTDAPRGGARFTLRLRPYSANRDAADKNASTSLGSVSKEVTKRISRRASAPQR